MTVLKVSEKPWVRQALKAPPSEPRLAAPLAPGVLARAKLLIVAGEVPEALPDPVPAPWGAVIMPVFIDAVAVAMGFLFQ